MAFEGLVTELKRLIKDRVPGSQAKESIESFGTTKFLLELGFVSSSRTFGSDVAEEHENGPRQQTQRRRSRAATTTKSPPTTFVKLHD